MLRESKTVIMRVDRIPLNWHSRLPIFASESFLKAVGNEYGWLGGFDNSGKLLCILPYTIVRKAIFRMVRFRVQTIPMVEEFSIEEEKLFLNKAIEYFRSIGADMIIPATTNSIFRAYPDGADVAPYGTFVIDLTQTEEKLWSDLHSNHRNKVRKAIKIGVKILSGMEYTDIAYKLFRDTFKRSGIGFMGQKQFTRMVNSLGKHVKIFCAFHQDVIQGCLLMPFSEYSAYALHSGRSPKVTTGTMNLLRWEAIRQSHEMGIKRFDAVGVRIDPEKGSKQESLLMFKKRFGGQLNQGYMWKYSIHPLQYGCYSLAVRILRGGDIIDNERHKLIKK